MIKNLLVSLCIFLNSIPLMAAEKMKTYYLGSSTKLEFIKDEKTSKNFKAIFDNMETIVAATDRPYHRVKTISIPAFVEHQKQHPHTGSLLFDTPQKEINVVFNVIKYDYEPSSKLLTIYGKMAENEEVSTQKVEGLASFVINQDSDSSWFD